MCIVPLFGIMHIWNMARPLPRPWKWNYFLKLHYTLWLWSRRKVKTGYFSLYQIHIPEFLNMMFRKLDITKLWQRCIRLYFYIYFINFVDSGHYLYLYIPFSSTDSTKIAESLPEGPQQGSDLLLQHQGKLMLSLSPYVYIYTATLKLLLYCELC